IVLMDFGSGRDIGAVLASPSPAIDLAGTPLYLAPEVFAGNTATAASDIYSRGVLLYHLVSGRYPVEGNNRIEIQQAHADGRHIWRRDARPDLPDGFVRVIERALAANPEQRYQTAGEFDEALAGAVGGAGGGGVSYRWRMILAASGVLALAMAVIIALLPMASRRSPKSTPM